MKRLRCSCYSGGKKPRKMDKCFTDYLFSLCKSIGKIGTSFLKCHIVGFFLIFLWIQMLCAIYGSKGYIFYGTLHGVKSCLSYFVASSIIHSIFCLLTHCSSANYFSWQYFYFKSNMKNMVITLILRGLDFFLLGGMTGCGEVLFLRSKAKLFSFLNEESQQFWKWRYYLRKSLCLSDSHCLEFYGVFSFWCFSTSPSDMCVEIQTDLVDNISKTEI